MLFRSLDKGEQKIMQMPPINILIFSVF